MKWFFGNTEKPKPQRTIEDKWRGLEDGSGLVREWKDLMLDMHKRLKALENK